jgi:preprotein translocase subunit SecD
LTRIGLVEFRLVHEESEKLLQRGIIPPGYETLNEPRASLLRSNILVPLLVSKQAPAGMAGQKCSRVVMGRNAFNRPEIQFTFDAAGAVAFERVTTESVGRQLAIVVDGIICSAPRIRSPISGGHGSATSSFNDDEARMLITILRYPLETPAKLVEERRF